MYSVEVHADINIPGSYARITRYLVFNEYMGASNCIMSLSGREQQRSQPSDYFEAAKVSRSPVGEVVNDFSIETDWVLTYLEKTYN